MARRLHIAVEVVRVAVETVIRIAVHRLVSHRRHDARQCSLCWRRRRRWCRRWCRRWRWCSCRFHLVANFLVDAIAHVVGHAFEAVRAVVVLLGRRLRHVGMPRWAPHLA